MSRPFQVVPLSEVPTSTGRGKKRRLLRQYDDATLAFSNAVQDVREELE